MGVPAGVAATGGREPPGQEQHRVPVLLRGGAKRPAGGVPSGAGRQDLEDPRVRGPGARHARVPRMCGRGKGPGERRGVSPTKSPVALQEMAEDLEGTRLANDAIMRRLLARMFGTDTKDGPSSP